MKKVWGAIKFIGRLFFKPRTTFKGYKITLICLLEFVLIIDLLLIPFVIFCGVFISFLLLPLKYLLPLGIITIAIPILSIVCIAKSRHSRRQKGFLILGMALPLLVFLIGWSLYMVSSSFTRYFISPENIAIDSKGNIYATSGSSEYIFKFDPTGKQVLKFGQKDRMPQRIAIDNQGIIYATELFAKKILKFKTTGEFIEEIPINIEKRILIKDLEVNDKGNIYLLVSQGEQERPRKYKARMPVFNAQGKFLFDIPIDKDREKVSCWDFSMDSKGNIYLGDLHSYQILVFDSRGQLIKTLGTKDSKSPHYFGAPWNIDVDNESNIYIARSFNLHKGDADFVTKLNSEGKILMTIKGKKVKDWTEYLAPFDIEVDNQGNIYVADLSLNHQIYKFDKEGKQLLSIKPTNIWARICIKILKEKSKERQASRESGKTCPTCK